MVILDTCAIIELCAPEPKLSDNTLALINKGAFILSISFAEIACKIKLGKLEISITPKRLYEEFLQIKEVEFVDTNVNRWLSSIDLNWPENKDPADRLITSFAIEKKIAIVSSDLKMKKFYKNLIW